MKTHGRLTLHGRFTIEVFDARSLLLVDSQSWSNLIVNTGGALALDLLAGAGGTPFDNANAHIGVGNSATAPAVSQTDLLGASTLRKAMSVTFPSRAGQVMTYQSLFGTGDANFAWNEIGMFNAAAAQIMLCRSLVSNPFTKTSGLTVTATYTITCP